MLKMNDSGLVAKLVPSRTFRTIGIRMRVKSMGKTQSTMKRENGKSWTEAGWFISSSITKGITRIKLTTTGNLRFNRILFIFAP